MISEKNNDLIVDIKVLPRSSLNKLEINGGEIRLKIKSPPVDRQANKEVIDFLSKIFSVRKKDISIVTGEWSRNKKIRIAGLTSEKFLAALSKGP